MKSRMLAGFALHSIISGRAFMSETSGTDKTPLLVPVEPVKPGALTPSAVNTTGTVEDIAAIIGGDVLKATAALPILTSAIAAGLASVTADQSKDLVTKGVDLIAALVPHAQQASDAGLIGAGDAAHISEAAALVTDAAESGNATVSALTKIVDWFKSWL